LSVNIRGLLLAKDRNKPAQIGDKMSSTGALGTVITESWLSPTILDAEVSIEGYHLYRADRSGRSRGGVCAYIREDLATIPCLQWSNGVVEVLVLKARSLGSLIVGVYRPPNTTMEEWTEAINVLEESISLAQANSHHFDRLLMFGDFNFGDIDWTNPAVGASGQAGQMLRFMNRQYMTNHVNEATRGTRILDLVLTNDNNFISHIVYEENRKFSDHCCLTTFISCDLEPRRSVDSAQPRSKIYSTVIPDYMIKLADDEDWTRFSMFLDQYDWELITSDFSLDQKIQQFSYMMEEAVTIIFPLHKGKGKGSRIPKDIRKLIASKSLLSRKIRRTCSAIKLIEYQDSLYEIEAKISARQEFRRSVKEKKAINVIRDDPAAFYKYAKKFSKDVNTIGPLVVEEREPVSDPAAMAEILTDQYSSVFSVPRDKINDDWIETLLCRPVDDPMDTLDELFVVIGDVEKAISDMSSSSSPGPDGIPPVCFKKGGATVSRALLDIFRLSLDNSLVPDCLKIGWITPIYKGGNRTCPANYRPVALSGHVSKLLERVVRKQLVSFLDNKADFDSTQHGSRSGRSTLSQLLAQHDAVLKLLENGGNAEILYLDFSKAFDKVDFGILLTKLRKLGIGGKLLLWLVSYLTGRRQTVRIGDNLSRWCDVLSGVPQGSVLGPLLFLIFIADLGVDLDQAQAFVLKYVDDSKLVAGVSTEDDIELFQANLDRLYQWSSTNNMQWNGSKFQSLRMGPLNDLKNNTCLFSPQMSEVILPSKYVKDLGVLIDDDGTFKDQRNAAIRKTRQKAGWALRTFRSRDPDFMRTLWRSTIQPHQDYASQLWSPVDQVGDLVDQEGPLRTFTKRASGLRDLDYWTRLAVLRLQSVQRRAERYKLLYTVKMLHSMVPNVGVSVHSEISSRGGRTLSIPDNKGSRAAVRSQKNRFLLTEGPRLFNSLPIEIRNFTGPFMGFKHLVDLHLDELPDCPHLDHEYVPAAVDSNGRPSNSIKDWEVYIRRPDATQSR
jgi:ribonuclease P/MRP protein subunit RPP40